MPVAEFLAKVDALEKRGAMALFSKDFGLLKAEVQASGKAVRAEEMAARKAGRRPATCLPKKAGVKSGELLAHFRAIPPAQRGMSVKVAFAGLMAKKFPCPRA
jgi:hypothetical protein